MRDLIGDSQQLGAQMYTAYNGHTGKECNGLLLEWAKEMFWGRVIKDHLPMFDELWELLSSNGHTSEKKSISLGDIDQSVWVEKAKGKKVIVDIRHCAARDDNTTIYIKNDPFEIPGLSYSILDTFVCRRAWPRQITSKGYKCAVSAANPTGWYTWGDDRDIDQPSLNTYRKRNFNFGCLYQRGYVFEYHQSHRGPQAERAYLTELEIPSALENLRWTLQETKEISLRSEK